MQKTATQVMLECPPHPIPQFLLTACSASPIIAVRQLDVTVTSESCSKGLGKEGMIGNTRP